MMDIFDANTSTWIFDTFQQHLKALSAVAVLMDNSAPALVGFSKTYRELALYQQYCSVLTWALLGCSIPTGVLDYSKRP